MSIFTELLKSGLSSILGGYMDKIIGEFFNVLIALCIPMFIVACIKTFFGYRYSKLLYVLDGILGGSLVGAILFGMLFKGTIGVVAGMIAGGIGGGILLLKYYQAGTGYMGFRFGFVLGIILTLMLKGPLSTGLLLGLAGGIGGIFVLLKIGKRAIIAAMSIMGAAGMGVFVMLLDRFSPTIRIVGGVAFIAVAALGYYVQYREAAKAGDIDETPFSKNAASAAKLIGVEGCFKGSEFVLNGKCVIGREAQSCSIIFPKESNGISRIQCSVFAQSGRVSVCDNNSSYGTFLNGKKLQPGENVAAKNGDLISMGDNNVFRVQV